jgi:S-DNA-T family DNA segregation ATPase FtsK/SpoIIIE
MRDNEFTPFEPPTPEYDNSASSSKKEKSTKEKKTVDQEKTNSKAKDTAKEPFFKTRRFRITSGLLLLSISVFLLFACLSYLLTWKADQDSVMGHSIFEYFFSSGVPSPDNWLGKFGAWWSHWLLYNTFGIPSIGFCFLGFIIGFKQTTKTDLLPIGKTSLITLSYMVWASIFLGYFNTYLNFAGGTFGFFINEWLCLTFGNIPALLFSLVLLIMLTTLLFNPDYAALWAKFREKTLKDDYFELEDDQETTTSNPYNSMDVVNPLKENELEVDNVSTPVEFDNSLEDDFTELDDPHLPENELEFEIELVPQEAPVEETMEAETDTLPADGELYDPTKDLSSYQLPPIDLLKDYGSNSVASVTKEELESNKDRIVETLSHYKIDIAKIKATVGPTVTLYEIIPAPGVRIAKIKNLEDDIALSLSALGIRIIAPIPGKGTIGIEVPNSKPEMVSMRSLIASEKFQNFDGELPIVMGKTITNETFTFDLTKMPHLLVAGTTGQGKSVGLNAILVSLLYRKHPAQVKFVLVDPKKVELTLYNKIERHFLAKLPNEEEAIIVDTSKVVNTLNSLCIEMDDRYELLKNAGVRTIKEYNAKFINRRLNPENGHRYLPYIVVLIDEFADLIMTAGKEVEHPIARIAQLARAIGIHLIVATQRPSVNVITGMIKANFPARIAFRVLSKIDSRTILDSSGADQLIGRGDMLISTGSDMIRLQCGFVDTPEVEEICDFVGNQRAYPSAFLLPEYIPEGSEASGDFSMDEIDPMFVDSARIVVINQQGSASLLQRKLKLGYNRAGRIVDQLEAMGIIGPFQGSKAREVLFSDVESLEEFMRNKGLV